MTESPNTEPAAVPAQRTDEPHVATVLRVARAMQRIGMVLAVAVAVVAVLLAYLLRGAPGAVGALVGALIAVGMGFLGTFVMAKTARATPIGVMAGALVAFAGKIAFMLVFLLLFRGTTLFDNQSFAFTLLAVTVAYLTGELVAFVRTRVPVVDL